MTKFEVNTNMIPSECANSLVQILFYSGLPEERADLFVICLDAFRELKDKLAVDRETSNIRDAVTPVFFEVYESAARRMINEGNAPKIIKMFLMYGYMDERLLSPEQVCALWELCDMEDKSDTYTVYNMAAWLTRIYRMEKEPSINEYGQDYLEVFRDKRRRGDLGEKDKMWWEGNRENRLNHEVSGVTRLGQRLSYGRMSGFFPVLYKEMISGDLKKAFVSKKRIETSLNRILAIDHSAFHREVVYNQPEKGIVQQLIMKKVLPDIILVPTFGIKGVMWQELVGRQSVSPGRLVLPAFCAEDLDLLMIDLVAKFRWYLSKVVSSSVRKEAASGSLYADYTNYLQFYKKNRDLSSEAKEKIKVLLDRYRNNMVEIYAGDYRTWILFESKGLMRLNKVAREILFKYCPFPRELRDKMEKQPLYNQMISQYNTICEREAKALEARYVRMNKSGGPLDSELAENLDYYRK